MNITWWQELRVTPLGRLNVSPHARACDYFLCLQSHSWHPFCVRSFVLADVNVVFFFAWMYQFPTATLNAYALLSCSPSKFVSCTCIGLVINLSWLYFSSLPICIYYYPFCFFLPSVQQQLYCTVISLAWNQFSFPAKCHISYKVLLLQE